ncbi:MAG: nucleotide sugar dehydrogenase [Chloroflexi bacterium]|nr:nucleotide sugar dehydrogenase [Chloroflexota bacterium]
MGKAFERKVADRTATVGIVGLGYVGLPLGVAFARAGFPVIGVDLSAEKVAALTRGESYILDVPAGHVREQLDSGRFRATVEFDALSVADAIFVCVPTPFDRAKAPDLSFITSAAESLVPVLRKGQLILLESTTYPGTTEEVLIPILERSGLRAGADFSVAFSPERIDPGNRTYTIANTPKVVGGIDRDSTDRAALLLQQVVKEGAVHRVSTPRAAELTKLLENTFRAVNIALVNELAVLCDRMGIDVWEVIDAAKTKPYGFMAFYPGPGVGGHCIPVDPYYLSWKAREYDFSTKFIEVAAETNQDMPFFAVEKFRRQLGAHGRALLGARVLVLGAAFKRDIDDARNSSAIKVIEILRREGAEVRYHDPHVPMIRVADTVYGEAERNVEMRSVELTDSEIGAADAVAILVGHTAVDYAKLRAKAKLLFDAVNVLASPGSADGRHVRL